MVLSLSFPALAKSLSYCSCAMATRSVCSSMLFATVSVRLAMSSSFVTASSLVRFHRVVSFERASCKYLLAFSFLVYSSAICSAAVLPLVLVLEPPLVFLPAAAEAAVTVSCACFRKSAPSAQLLPCAFTPGRAPLLVIPPASFDNPFFTFCPA